ncbi:MAG TPA: hypothetical protein VF765_02460 [Polyangiaceae bacterium]
MRARLTAIACLLVMTSTSRWSDAAGTASEDAIARYEDWAEGRPSPQPIDPADMPPRDSAPRTTIGWYGWQTLLVDGASLFLQGVGEQLPGTGGTLLGVTGFLGYVAVAPAVHGFHHRDGALLADLVLRIALPIAAESAASRAFAAWAVVQPYGSGASAAGAGVAVALDALLLAWDRRGSRSDTGRSWLPRACATPNGVSAALSGTF